MEGGRRRYGTECWSERRDIGWREGGRKMRCSKVGVGVAGKSGAHVEPWRTTGREGELGKGESVDNATDW